MPWNIVYRYLKEEKPVEEFIKSLSRITISKVTRMINLLENNGNLLRMPYSKKLTKEIFELRIRGIEEVRILYSFGRGQTIYLLHGFKKKTQKTPIKEIRLAEARLKRAGI